MKKKIIKINKLLIAEYGVRKRKNTLRDPLDTLIATILSQNTTDKNSYKAYQNLKASFKNWDEVSKANVKAIEQKIRIGGLSNQKAKAIKTILRELNKNHNKISLDYLNKLSDLNMIAELTKFNGVGVKTASCVLLFALNRNICPVDTHVHRVLNRVGLVKTKTPDKTFEILNKNLPDGVAYSFHTNLIKLGRDYCKAGKPLCFACLLVNVCAFPNKNLEPDNRVNKNHFLLLSKL